MTNATTLTHLADLDHRTSRRAHAVVVTIRSYIGELLDAADVVVLPPAMTSLRDALTDLTRALEHCDLGGDRGNDIRAAVRDAGDASDDALGLRTMTLTRALDDALDVASDLDLADAIRSTLDATE